MKNYSITGLLVIIASEALGAAQPVLAAQPKVDLYLPDMRLAAEMNVVRMDETAEGLQLALAFVQISYDVDSVFYTRRAYRKRLDVLGHLVFEGETIAFRTVNATVEGCMVFFAARTSIPVGTLTTIAIDSMPLSGEVSVMWLEDDAKGGTLMGLQYIHLESRCEPASGKEKVSLLG